MKPDTKIRLLIVGIILTISALVNTRRAQGIWAQLFRCPCTKRLDGPWYEAGDKVIVLFWPYKGWTAEKRCPLCHGTGRTIFGMRFVPQEKQDA
jgi:hypothetical protein